ncbi:WGR domain-containing protein [Rhizobium sp. C4]|uniref:WGR domain-containing protein n=1 Tax=Rhizobium sp. C4 TaxID=1349800 RepID=UPI001E40E3F1|nr:WGR domain-containing protein [Rhizobium sp. C4]MCD2175956.1 WGR domain-containing protein [Rhizobium sp. C4]
MTIAPLPFYAERLDPTRNMARFYALEVSEDLFGKTRLERRWGRIGSRGQVKVELVLTSAEASKRIDALVRQKTRRGYLPK